MEGYKVTQTPEEVQELLNKIGAFDTALFFFRKDGDHKYFAITNGNQRMDFNGEGIITISPNDRHESVNGIVQIMGASLFVDDKIFSENREVVVESDITLPVTDDCYRYRLLFTSVDGKSLIPSNTSTSTSATTAKAVNQRPFDPFAPIYVFRSPENAVAGSRPESSVLLQHGKFILGYAINTTGTTLVLNLRTPVYLKCSPQSDGSVVLDSTVPYVQALPAAHDGYVYILLGYSYTTVGVEMIQEHPVYYIDTDGRRRMWTGEAI